MALYYCIGLDVTVNGRTLHATSNVVAAAAAAAAELQSFTTAAGKQVVRPLITLTPTSAND